MGIVKNCYNDVKIYRQQYSGHKSQAAGHCQLQQSGHLQGQQQETSLQSHSSGPGGAQSDWEDFENSVLVQSRSANI